MTLDALDIKAAIANVETQLQEDQQTSLAMKSAVGLLLILVKLLLARWGLNSRNSSKPPASDPNRERKARLSSGRKVGGQIGSVGTTLTPTDNPDAIQRIEIDRRSLPSGQYIDAGFERRQVIDLQIDCVVTEYRAQILADQNGKQFVAEFPAGVTRPVHDYMDAGGRVTQEQLPSMGRR